MRLGANRVKWLQAWDTSSFCRWQ